MNTHSNVGGTKPAKQPYPLSAGGRSSIAKITPRNVFLRAMEDRITNRPFDRISAYKVRESRGNIASTIGTLNEIISVVSKGETLSVPILLGGCTTEDKSIWLKDLPGNLAHELGYNLISALQALKVEGVPEPTIDRFIQSIKRDVCQLLKDCDAVQTDTGRSVKGEYARMKAGCSDMLRICNDALRIADQAKLFCQQHGVW